MGSSKGTMEPSHVSDRYTSQQTRSRKQGNHYEPFPGDNEMKTFPSQRETRSDKLKGLTDTVVNAGIRKDVDNTSQEGILQSRTFTVQYD